MGERVGKYELREKLGEGGFGRVWKAWDGDLEVWRALKEPHDQSPRLEAELKEARMQARLDHPGLVRILGTERIDGRFFLVTEFVEGGTLRARLQQGGKPTREEADRLLRGILEALAYAHGKGIVHLDLKPENVFVLPDGALKIGDFGLARLVDRGLATMSRVQGTLLYMAPEQLEGKAGPSVDLWAVGAIAYELYTGTFALVGETHGTWVKSVTEGRVRDLAAVPEERRALVTALLQPDPAKRCPSAQEALALLGPAAGSRAAGDSAAEPALAPPRRRSFRWAVAAATLVLGLAGFGYGAWFGLIDAPWVEAALARLEPAPPAEHPPADFYALDAAGRLDRAWEYADAGQFPRAWKAAQETPAAQASPAVAAEALYLEASLEARHLERPRHAVVDLRRYLAAYPEGRHALPARLLLAEVYGDLHWVRKSAAVLDEAVRRHPGDPLLADAVALANRYEAELRAGAVPGLEVGKTALASLLPNNLPSLGLSFMSFAAFLLPGMFWIAMGFHTEGDKESERSPRSMLKPFRKIWSSKVHRALFLGFLAFQGLQYYLNQRSAATAETELTEVVQLIKANVKP